MDRARVEAVIRCHKVLRDCSGHDTI